MAYHRVVRLPRNLKPLLLSTAVLAASQAQAQLEEVIVTAQKREQSLQDAPIAITAFGQHALEQKGVRDLVDLGTFAPNVKVAPLPSNTAKATVAIRGSVTSNPGIYWEPTVGIYLDGAYVGKFSGNVFKLAEVERIEILRGPQGTLFGRNTSGGAINVITQVPTGELGGKLRAGVGNFGYRELSGTLDLPAVQLGEAGSLAAKLSLSTDERDGFYDNVEPAPGTTITHPFTGQPIPANPASRKDSNAADSTIGRIDLMWDVSDRLSIRYAYDDVDVDNTPAKPQLTHLDTTNLTFGFPLPADLAQFVSSESKNLSKNSLDADIWEKFESKSHTLTAEYGLGELGFMGDVSLKYIFNDRDLDFTFGLDNDGTPFHIYHSSIFEDYSQRSHELQWTGSLDRVDYVMGLYYFEEQADVENPLRPLNSFFGPLLNDNRYGLESDQVAVYAQANWTPAMLEDRLTLTAGLRWTDEEKSVYIDHPGDNLPFKGKNKKSFSNVSPTVIVAYDFSDQLNAYAKYAQGWKSGGFSGEAVSLEAFNEGYTAEEIDSWEIGIKSRWLNSTLQINAAAFFNDEKDIQLTVFVPDASGGTSSVVKNAGSAEKKGAEVEVVFAPTADLMLSANYGYLDSKFKEFMEFDPVLGRSVNVADQRYTQYTPRHTVNLGIDYTVLRANFGELNAHVDYSYNDDYSPYVKPDQRAVSKVDGYGLFNARLTLSNIPVGDNQLQLSLWAKNLRDEAYRLNTIPFGPMTTSFFGNPRTYGLEAQFSF